MFYLYLFLSWPKAGECDSLLKREVFLVTPFFPIRISKDQLKLRWCVLGEEQDLCKIGGVRESIKLEWSISSKLASHWFLRAPKLTPSDKFPQEQKIIPCRKGEPKALHTSKKKKKMVTMDIKGEMNF